MVDSATTPQTATPPKTEEKGLLSRAWGGITGIFSGHKDNNTQTNDHPADKAATTTPTPAATQTAAADKAKGAPVPGSPEAENAKNKELVRSPSMVAYAEARQAVEEKVAISLKKSELLENLGKELGVTIERPKDDAGYRKLAHQLVEDRTLTTSTGQSINIDHPDFPGIKEETKVALTTIASQIPTAKQRDDIADSVGKAVGGNTGGFFGASLDNLLGALMSYFMESVIGNSDKGFKQYMAEAISSGITEDLTKNLKEKGVSDDLSKQVIAATQAEVRKKSGLPAPEGTPAEETLATTKTPAEQAALDAKQKPTQAPAPEQAPTVETPAPAVDHPAATAAPTQNNKPAPAKPEPSKKGGTKATNADQVLAAMHLPERLQTAGITGEQAKDVLAHAKQTVTASLKAHSKDKPAKQADAVADALMADKVVASALKTITDKEMAHEKVATQKLYAATQNSPKANHEYIETRTEREVLAALTGKPAHSTPAPTAKQPPAAEKKTAMVVQTNTTKTTAQPAPVTVVASDNGEALRATITNITNSLQKNYPLVGDAVKQAATTQIFEYLKHNPQALKQSPETLASNLTNTLFAEKSPTREAIGETALLVGEGTIRTKTQAGLQKAIADNRGQLQDAATKLTGKQLASLDNHDIKAQIAAACNGMSGIGKSMADVNNGTCVSPKQVSGGVDLGGQMLG